MTKAKGLNLTKIAVVELDKEDVRPLGTGKELSGAIVALGAQLGFQELLRRFRVTRAILRTRLEQPSEDENRHQLRALIEAYGFVERQLRQEAGRPVEEPREAYQDERLEYERLAKYVELIGRGGQSN
jgi:hypothetical protein